MGKDRQRVVYFTCFIGGSKLLTTRCSITWLFFVVQNEWVQTVNIDTRNRIQELRSGKQWIRGKQWEILITFCLPFQVSIWQVNIWNSISFSQSLNIASSSYSSHFPTFILITESGSFGRLGWSNVIHDVITCQTDVNPLMSSWTEMCV